MYGIDDLAEEYGFDDVMDFLEEYGMDAVVPGICTQCGATYEYEPDQDAGWCEICSTNSVKSGLVLMGII
jgi:hypothetical protein